jgi:hypothetical protein
MVGAPGFEPGTSRTPSVRATRLRYAPTRKEAAQTAPRPTKTGYHRFSSRVKNALRESRISSSIFRLRS